MDALDNHLCSISEELSEATGRGSIIFNLQDRIAKGLKPSSSLVNSAKERISKHDWALCPLMEYLYRNGLGVPQDDFVAELLHEISEANITCESAWLREFVNTVEHKDSISPSAVQSDASSEGCVDAEDDELDFTVIDIETTGFSPTRDEITELAAIRVRNNKIVDSFHELVSIKGEIPRAVIEKTHITPELLEGARSIEQVLPDFIDFLGDDVLVGHNIEKFDVKFIAFQAKLLGVYFDKRVVDSLHLAKQCLPDLPHYTLDYLRQYFAIDSSGAHRALQDCEDTLKVIQAIRSGGSAEFDPGDESCCDEDFDVCDPITISVPPSYKPSIKPDIPTSYKEHWDYVRAHPFETLASANIVFTGSSSAMPRDYAERLAVTLGANLKNSVTRICDFCVILSGSHANSEYVSGKVEKALQLQSKGGSVRIIGLQEFVSLCMATLAS